MSLSRTLKERERDRERERQRERERERERERGREEEKTEKEREGVYDDNRITCTLAYSWLMSMMRCTIC